MSRILVLGARGMMGHKACQLLPTFGHEVFGTLRGNRDEVDGYSSIYEQTKLIELVDATDDATLDRVIRDVRPDVIFNCVGIIKQLPQANNALISVRLNSYLPHLLAQLAHEHGSRLIHISTDCVFDGERGSFTEADHSNARDLYGKSKHLGETTDDETAAVTLRTSIIGRELNQPGHGLVEWFCQQNGGQCNGFTRAIYTGFTTIEMVRVIDLVIRHPDLRGMYHVASAAINKYDLLCLIKRTLDLNITVEQDDQFHCDRSLVMDRFTRETGYAAPLWDRMIEDMRNDPTPYDEWR